MPESQTPLPAAITSREAIAQAEIGHTAVTARTVRRLVLVFLTTIAVVPFVEVVGVVSTSSDTEPTAWAHLADLRSQIEARTTDAGQAGAGAWSRIVAGNRAVLSALDAFETTLDNQSALGRLLRAPAQVLMSGWLGTGNERVYPGHDGWLFFRPDVEYVTGPGFLAPRQMQRRIASAAEWTKPPQPDPRPAIVRFHRDLAARGIALIVMPTPVKPTIHPERLARRYGNQSAPLQNPSHAALVADFRRDGVLVFDPADVLARARVDGPAYLATDTHWRPETMELVAARLASVIEANITLPPTPDPGYRVERREVRQAGDLTQMLDLPAWQQRFPPESVWIARVLGADGSPWQPSRQADVLLLGDSFTNIYSLESMGWGSAAGFAEQVSRVLRRPVDRLVQNDEGAYATRALLLRDVSRLDTVRVVVYQFATRELAGGDWKVIELPPDRSP